MIFISLMVVVAAPIFLFALPETKGVSLEDMGPLFGEEREQEEAPVIEVVLSAHEAGAKKDMA